MPDPDSDFSKATENNESSVIRYISSSSSSASNVYLRIKPNSGETNQEIYTVVGSTTLLVKKGENLDKRYGFTRIFDSDTSQADLFYHSIRHQVIHFLLGKDSTILTYGVSNSGKTYTLYGTPESPGVIPRTIELLFSSVNCTLAPWYKITDDNRIVTLNEFERTRELHSKTDLLNPKVITKDEYTQARLSLNNTNPQLAEQEEQEYWGDECMSSVWISVAEIYNDNVYDLLNVNDQERRPLKVTTGRDGSTYVNCLKFLPITTALEACQLLIFVQSRMTVAQTAMNVANSQSHTLLTLKLLKYEEENAPDKVRVSTLTFCDVAGSRRFKTREETGARLLESKNINNSLVVLGRCLKNLRSSHLSGDHVAGPFRESKLTRILQRVLSGREMVSFIVTIDTTSETFPETLSVLNFSTMARRLGNESRVSRRNTVSTITPLSSKSSTMTSVTQSPRKTLTIDVDEYEKNEKLKNRVETLERDNLNRELDVRQELMDQYSATIEELESSWKKRAKDIEDKGQDLLKWSVDQVETFYKERIDSLIYNKKRKRNDNDNADGIRLIYEELETENALITSKVVVLREMVQSLRTENELLSTDRNKCNFELTLIRKKLKAFHDLLRLRFPELFLKVHDNTNDVSWLIHELKRMFDEKVENIQVLEKDLSRATDDYVKMATKSIEMEKELCNTKISLQETLNKTKDFETDIREKTNRIHGLQFQLQLLRKELVDVRECEIDYGTSKSSRKGNIQSLARNYYPGYSDEFFGNDNVDNTELTQARVDIKAEHYFNHADTNSLKKVYMHTVDTDIDRHTIRSSDSGNAKEDSGIDFSCRSQISISINGGSSIKEVKENCTQTTSQLPDNTDTNDTRERIEQTESTIDLVSSEEYTKKEREVLLSKGLSSQMNDTRSHVLKRIADFNKSETARCTSKLLTFQVKMEELKKENEKLRKLIEIDSQKYNERIKELTDELLLKEEDDIRNLKQLEGCLEKCAYLENQLSVLHLVHEETVRSLTNRRVERGTQVEKLEMEPSMESLQAEETGGEVAEARSDLFRVQQLQEKVNGLETVLEKCREEKNNYRERLQEHLEMQSMLEMKLKWLSTEVRNRDDELICLKAEVDNMVLANNSNNESVKSLSEEIVRSSDSVNCMNEKLTFLEETRQRLEETLESKILESRLSSGYLVKDTASLNKVDEEEKEKEVESCDLKLRLCENEREMVSLKKHRNDMIKKYECMVQHLRIQVEKKKEQMIKLQKLLLSNFTWRYRKLAGRRSDKSTTFQLQKLANYSNRDWKLPIVNKSNEERSLSMMKGSMDSSSYANSLNSQFSTKNAGSDTNSACETEASFSTESSLGLNDSNVDARQIQSDASDCCEVHCGCGIGFKNAGRHGRMSGWMKVRRSNANTCLLLQLDGE
ncbi:Kinesin-like protein KIF20B [Eufriesea mexicana]|uniref:Kinesin-like protein KIF20B n=1 Tax=Eufriesea mexicana TaxID=516756 RepID=A0A310S891_9HYME|nr:Kinesin-like protein KIF20B [Eufriesea mexicana]